MAACCDYMGPPGNCPCMRRNYLLPPYWWFEDRVRREPFKLPDLTRPQKYDAFGEFPRKPEAMRPEHV